MLKKLLLIFWEVVPKTDSEGKLMQEMILVCDAYRKDLQHPNEFIRGATLRFLCKLKVRYCYLLSRILKDWRILSMLSLYKCDTKSFDVILNTEISFLLQF